MEGDGAAGLVTQPIELTRDAAHFTNFFTCAVRNNMRGGEKHRNHLSSGLCQIQVDISYLRLALGVHMQEQGAPSFSPPPKSQENMAHAHRALKNCELGIRYVQSTGYV